MFQVKDFMSKEVISCDKETTISEIIDLMKEKGIHRVPVCEQGKLVGLITEGMISNAGIGQATSLSIYELNYLLSKTKAKTVMVKQVHTVNENELVEFATSRMLKYDIGCLPVVDDQGYVTGILTQNDVFKSFLTLLGWDEVGSRIVVTLKDEMGALGKISKLFVDAGVSIKHMGSYFLNDLAHMVIRCDSLNPQPLVDKLNEAGFQVIEVQIHQ